MTTTRSKAKPLLAILVFLALLSSTWPVATATHVNDSVAVPLPSGLVPLTGVGPVDSAAKSGTGPADAAAKSMNDAIAGALNEPEIPATYFRDSLDLLEQDHLGGWGLWMTGDSATPLQGTGWHRTTLPGSEREGFAFGDEEGYAIRTDRTLNSLLVSPRISLDALPIDSPTGPDARGPQQVAAGPATIGPLPPVPLDASDAIRLYVDHRFNFANGIDAGQVLAFNNAPPSKNDLENPGVRGLALTPLAEMLPPTGFTGPREAFYRSTFDLTPLAGQDVWLVFHAAVMPQGSPAQHFQRENRFDLELPFYGWQLDNVLLEGPAYPHNIKIDAIVHPQRVVNGQLALAPGDGQDNLTIVVLNRGQFTQDIRPTLTLTDSTGQSEDYPVAPMTLRLRPGETRAVEFKDSLLFLKEGESYTAIFDAELVGQRDAYLPDNSLEVMFVAQRSPGVLVATPLAVSPRTGDPAAERQATVTILNTGNGRETVHVDFVVEYEDPSDGSFVDVTQTVVEAESPSVSEPFVLEPGQSSRLAWTLVLSEPGRYRILLDGLVDAPEAYGLVEFSGEAQAATLLSAGTVYATDFTSDDGWEVKFAGDTQPPCKVGDYGQQGSVCPEFLWEMPSNCNQACKTLIAFADTDHLGDDVEPDTPIETLRIDVTQWLDAPCRTRADGEDECRYPDRGTPTSSWLDVMPSPHTTQLWYRSPMQGRVTYGGSTSWDVPASPTSIGPSGIYGAPSQANTVLQDFRFGYFTETTSRYNNGGTDLAQSHPGNRLNHYSGKWISETYTVPIVDFATRLQNQEWVNHAPIAFSGGAPTTTPMPTMPLEAFDDLLNLRFVGGVAGGCGTSGDSWLCPSWRISEAAITGITPEGEELVLAHWNGRVDETRGHWARGSDYERSLDEILAPLVSLLDPYNDAVAEGTVNGSCLWATFPVVGGRGVLCPIGAAPFSQPTGWRLRSVETLGDPAAEEYNRFDSTTGWQRVPSFGGRSGVWTNADGPKNANGVPAQEHGWTHSNLQASLLQSPVIPIPADAAAPKVEFDHRFHLLREGVTRNGQGAQTCCWISDYGTLMVRFLDIDGEATTPYMQVALSYEPPSPFDPTMAAAGLGSDVHRFFGNDCVYYERTDCDPRDPSRAPVTHQLDLGRLPILDYSRVLVPPQGGFYWTQCSDGLDNNGGGQIDFPNDPGCQGPNDNWEAPNLPELEIPHAQPDLQALRLVDLRDGSIVWQQEGNEAQAPRLCDDSCMVQFAFRIQTGVHPQQNSHPTTGVNQWTYGYADNSPVGWFIDRFEVIAEEAQGHDIAITDAALRTRYAWESLGLGPGDEAHLELELENRGLFGQPVPGGSILVEVMLQRINPDGSLTDIPYPSIELPPSVVLPGLLSGAPQDERSALVTVPITIPDEDGSYRLLAKAHLSGELIPDHPGLLPVLDEAAADNCAAVVLTPDGTPTASLGECDISVLSPLPVRATPQLEVSIDVKPTAGRAGEDFPREVPITIWNTGNVEVYDFEVKRFFTDEEKETQVRTWTLPVSPPVDGNASLLALLLEDAEYQPKQDDYWVALLKESRYEIGAVIPEFNSEDILLIDSFDSFYSDAFLASPDYGEGRVASGRTAPENETGPWQTITGTGPSGASRGWHFGDAQRQTYPDGTDEALMLPPFDLSSVARGSLSLTHQYDFETGYDGGRVEVSLDAGDTWRPLVPARGYASPQDGQNTMVYPGNPMNPDQDPLAETPAWTGSSGGWTIDEFDLGQVEDLVTETLLYEFSQSGYSLNPSTILTREVPGEMGSDFDRASFSTTWAHPVTASCSSADPLLEKCWYREDVHMGFPARNPAGDLEHDGKHWWTGQGNGVVALHLDVVVPPANAQEYPSLSFWRWEDTDAAQAFSFWIDRDDDGDLDSMPTSDFRFSEDVAARTDEGWRRFSMNLAGFQDDTQPITVPVEFRFNFNALGGTGAASSPFRDPFHDRGGLLDNVQLLSVQRVTEHLVDAHSFPTSSGAWVNPEWTAVDTIDSPAPAWNPREIAGRTGETTAFLFGSLLPTNGGEDAPSHYYNYPKDARERLVTPIVDLTAVGGAQARATFWEAFNFQYFGTRNPNGPDIDQDRRREIMVQALRPTLEGEVPGPWVRVGAMADMNSRNCEEPRPPGWCQRTIDLSDFIGQRIRIGFDIRTDSFDANTYCRNEAVNFEPSRLGCFWAIDGLEVFADTVAGQPILVRLRAASDGTVGDGGWTIDNVQFVGYAYQENVAIIPDPSLPEPRMAPGATFTLTGEVRNLGERTTDSLALRAVAAADAFPGVVPPSLDIDFDIEGGGPLMEFTLLGAGAKNDRTDYELRVQVPSGAVENTIYTVNLEVVELTGSGTPTSFVDDNTGDHRRTFNFVVETSAQLAHDTEGAISPLTASSGQPVNVTLDFTSIGTLPAAVDSISFTVRDPRTGALVATSKEEDLNPSYRDAIAPGASHSINWTWLPDAQARGFYRIDAVIKYGYHGLDFVPPATPVGVVLVGEKPIYYQETFSVTNLADAGWLSSQTCSISRDCWRLREDISYAGTKSVYIGPSDLTAGTHLPRQDVRMDGPVIDLTALQLLNDLEFRDSPFNPSLTFRYQANLGDNDGVIVEALRPNLDGDLHRYLDTADYTGQIVRGNAQTGNAMMQNLPANHDPADAFTDRRLDTWRPVSVPLGPATGSSNGVALLNEHRLVGHDVSFAFRFGSSLAGNRGQAFTLDAVTVSSYASIVQPAEANATLTTGADKVFHFRVENTGPAKDTFTISLAPESALTVFDVQILTPSITLEAGESALARVRVAAPSFELGGGAGGFLLLEVASLGDPNSVATAALTLTYLSTALPDLAVKLDRPDGGGTTIHVDTPTSFLATVTNIAGKRESRPTSLEVGVCPWDTGDPAIDLVTCRTQGTWTVLGTRSLGVLQPGEAQSEPVTWIPKESMTGRVHIIAQADPMGLLRESTRDNNIHSRTMDVLVVDRPHLRVIPDSLKVMRGQDEVHKAIEGDLLQITGTIENSGTADAQGTLVRLVNQFPLLSKNLDRLAPGQEVTFSTQWRAEPGNWIILLEIIPGLGSMQDGDEGLSARWDLAVERGRVGFAIEPTDLRLEPGRSHEAFVRVINDRATTTTFVARLHGQDDVLLTGLPARFNLTAGEVQEYAVQVAASPFAQAGPRTIKIDLHTDPLLPPVAHTEIEVTVGRAEPVTFHAGRVTTGSGTARVSVDVTNHGTKASPIQIQPQAPAGWDVATPAPVTVEPGATRSIEILVTVPPGTAPGRYAVEIRTEGVQRAAAVVEVLPAPAWQSKIEYTTLAEDGATLVWVRIENTGNAAGLPLLDVLGQEAGASVEPPLHILEPGQVQVFRVQLSAGSSLILPGQLEPTELPPPGDGTRVQVMRWQLLPRGTLQAGDTGRIKVELLNPSSLTHAEYPLVLYINGFLAAEAAVSLAAGGTATVELPWMARAGEHVVSVTHGDLEETTINEFVKVDAQDKQMPGLSPLFIVLLFAALTLVGRRRRQ